MNFERELPCDKKLVRAANLVVDIHRILSKSGTYREFATGQGNSLDAIHRIRLFHDQFLLDAFKNRCSGTIYRSKTIIESKEQMIGKNAAGTNLHCEHSIPVSLIGRYIFQNFKNESLEDLGVFLFKIQVVCGISLLEKNSVLNQTRDYGGVNRKWARDHPNFIKGECLSLKSEDGCDIELGQVKVFHRYKGTGISVVNVITREEVDIDTYTLDDHFTMVSEHCEDLESCFRSRLQSIVQKIDQMDSV